MKPRTELCFHCGEPFAGPGSVRSILVEDAPREVCCAGCEAAALLISAAGLGDYYRWRTAPAPRPGEVIDDPWSAFDAPEVVSGQAVEDGGALRVQLLIEGTRCAACSWLIEHRLAQLPGVKSFALNPATSRGQISFLPALLPLSVLLRSVAQLGYTPHLLGCTDTLEVATRERRTALKRLVVAGFGMMQVMMIAVGLYAGAFHGIEPVVRSYLRIISLIVTTPVTAYAAQPLFTGAVRAALHRRMSMDLPVALGIGAAYVISAWHTFTGSGEVYFDSVTMFVFLLLLGRYVEMLARHYAGSTTEALARLLPAAAIRLTESGAEEHVPLAALKVGDTIRVAAGAAFAADGCVRTGTSEVDEALLTGESATVVRRPGDAVIAGAINVAAPLEVTVTALGSSTVLASIVGLLERAQSERPRLARAADTASAWFLSVVLVAAAAAAAVWLMLDPSRAFEATFAVLVVACPCALSLATPVAVAAATARLARQGLLVTRADALEALASADQVLFDKTGTLTRGQPTVTAVTLAGRFDAARCSAWAAALEQGSGHPIAHAFAAAPGMTVERRIGLPGAGVEGTIDGVRMRIGHAAYVGALAGARPAELAEDGVHLGSERGWLARFELSDALRSDARRAVATLCALGLTPSIASGDRAASVAGIARALGISRYAARATPDDKLAHITALRAAGARVMVVGDGINDAPCMKAAWVSVAVGSGTALAQVSADIVMVRNDLGALSGAVETARRTARVIRQNLSWAACYNIVSLPAAALGFVPPWLAAVGMSASSLFVVLNSARLTRAPGPARRRTKVVPPAEPVAV